MPTVAQTLYTISGQELTHASMLHDLVARALSAGLNFCENLCYNRGKRFLISRSFSFVPHGGNRAEFL